jgi:hypothetical protein
MVLRSVVAHFLILLLLACPYPCLTRAEACVQGPAKGKCRPHDSCCSCPCSKTGEDRPGAPVSCPEGGTCLCHGAVMERHVAPPNPDCQFVTFLPLDAMHVVQGAVAIERDFFAEQAACHFPAVDSGRAVRALIGSLLL